MSCRCGHPKGAHQHYRPGADCSACSCCRYRWKGLPSSGKKHLPDERSTT